MEGFNNIAIQQIETISGQQDKLASTMLSDPSIQFRDLLGYLIEGYKADETDKILPKDVKGAETLTITQNNAPSLSEDSDLRALKLKVNNDSDKDAYHEISAALGEITLLLQQVLMNIEAMPVAEGEQGISDLTRDFNLDQATILKSAIDGVERVPNKMADVMEVLFDVDQGVHPSNMASELVMPALFSGEPGPVESVMSQMKGDCEEKELLCKPMKTNQDGEISFSARLGSNPIMIQPIDSSEIDNRISHPLQTFTTFENPIEVVYPKPRVDANLVSNEFLHSNTKDLDPASSLSISSSINTTFRSDEDKVLGGSLKVSIGEKTPMFREMGEVSVEETSSIPLSEFIQVEELDQALKTFQKESLSEMPSAFPENDIQSREPPPGALKPLNHSLIQGNKNQLVTRSQLKPERDGIPTSISAHTEIPDSEKLLTKSPPGLIVDRQAESEAIIDVHSASKRVEPDRLAGAQADKWISRVEQELVTLYKSGKSHLRIQWIPDELGKIDLRLVSGNEGTNVAIIAENPSTAHLLDRHLGHLRQTLIQAGVNLGDLVVSSGYHGDSQYGAHDTMVMVPRSFSQQARMGTEGGTPDINIFIRMDDNSIYVDCRV